MNRFRIRRVPHNWTVQEYVPPHRTRKRGKMVDTPARWETLGYYPSFAWAAKGLHKIGLERALPEVVTTAQEMVDAWLAAESLSGALQATISEISTRSTSDRETRPQES